MATAAAAGPELSVVVPFHNEEGNVRELVSRLVRVVGSLDPGFELIAVDDGSTDSTRSVLRLLARQEPNLHVLLLSRNFGQEPAVQAGIASSRGRWLIQLDGDLQHPPEEIPKLLAKAREGYDVVYGQRLHRQDPWFRVWASKALLLIMRGLFGVPLPEDVSTFRVIDGQLARRVAGLPEKHKFMSALLSWSGAHATSLEVRHEPRKSGVSSYGLFRLLSHGLDLLAGFSFRPLRVIGATGVLFAALGSFYAVFKVAQKLSGADIQMGYTSLFSAIVIMGSLHLIALSVIGEYVGRIFLQTQGRPNFIVSEELNGRLANAPQQASEEASSGTGGVRSDGGRIELVNGATR
jgi:polyisoprenyl-phosphate glycosyltransferase